LASAKITSIITTQYRRTRDTAAPLAKATGIEPLVVPAERGDLPAHVRDVVNAIRRQSGNVLVVGHSDTVSAILAALNGPTLPKLCDNSFDHIYVLAYANPKGSFLHLRYGEPGAAPTEGCL
jgi:broad specificity phosphatase PhoE